MKRCAGCCKHKSLLAASCEAELLPAHHCSGLPSHQQFPNRYVLMSEPDHLWLKPMPNLMKGENPGGWLWGPSLGQGRPVAKPAGCVACVHPFWLKLMPNLMKGENPGGCRAGQVRSMCGVCAPCLVQVQVPAAQAQWLSCKYLSVTPPFLFAAAFPFFYIEPAKKEYRSIVETFLGPLSTKEAEQIAPIGEAHGRSSCCGCELAPHMRINHLPTLASLVQSMPASPVPLPAQATPLP